MIDLFGPHPMTIAILGAHVKIRGVNQSPPFLASTFANYLALIFRRLGGEGHVEVEEYGRICNDLVVLLCISRGCRRTRH